MYEPRCPSGARWSTIVGTRASAPISAASASIEFPISAADERRRERLLQRQVEVSRQDEHQQRHAEVEPEQRRVREAQHPQPLRHGRDSPTWCFHLTPFAGMTRIRFGGCDLSRS